MLTLSSITLKFDSVRALDGISLEIQSGRHTVVTGPSGSGKTSLLRVIAGLEKPQRGEVVISGRLCSSTGTMIAPGRRRIGFVFQRPALWPQLSLYSNVAYGLRRPGSAEGRARIRSLLEKLDLKGLEKRKPHELSGGEAQRASIARALAPAPAMLLLDEPFAGLDDRLRDRVIGLLTEEAERAGSTIIMATHNLADARRVCPSVVEIRQGRVAYSGEWDQLLISREIDA